MKESSGCIATARKETYALKSRRIRSATFGRDSLTSAATTATADQSARRRMTHPWLGPHVNSLVPFSPQSPANRGMICILRSHGRIEQCQKLAREHRIIAPINSFRNFLFSNFVSNGEVKHCHTEGSVSGIHFKHENQKGRTLPRAPIGAVRESRVLG